jgi:hypothetical protein
MDRELAARYQARLNQRELSMTIEGRLAWQPPIK